MNQNRCLCVIEVWTFNEFRVLKCLLHCEHSWVKSRWVSTWFIMSCLLVAIFPHFRHWKQPSSVRVNWLRICCSKSAERKEIMFHMRVYFKSLFIYWVWDFALWFWEICTWRELVVLKCLPQTEQLWLKSKCVSTWLRMCCFVLAVFPHFKHSNMPPEDWINWSR